MLPQALSTWVQHSELEKEHLSRRVTAQEFTWPPEWLFDAKEKGNDKWHQEEYFVPKFVTQRKNYSALTTIPQLQSVRQEIAEDQMGSNHLKGLGNHDFNKWMEFGEGNTNDLLRVNLWVCER